MEPLGHKPPHTHTHPCRRDNRQSGGRPSSRDADELGEDGRRDAAWRGRDGDAQVLLQPDAALLLELRAAVEEGLGHRDLGIILKISGRIVFGDFGHDFRYFNIFTEII